NGTPLNCLGREPDGQPCHGSRSLDDVLYEDGVFPRDASDAVGGAHKQNYGPQESPWQIVYGGPRSGMNSEDPVIATPGNDCNVQGSGNGGHATIDPNASGITAGSETPNCVVIVSMKTAKAWNINWDDANQIY